jgi:hypothetical protein
VIVECAASSHVFGLPGGLVRAGQLFSKGCFRAMTGSLEERLNGIARRRWSSPRQVTAILSHTVAVFDDTGEHDGRAAEEWVPLDLRAAGQLCVADRQFLMIQLARWLCGDDLWVYPRCCRCEATFDVAVSRAALPVKSAGSTFPFARVALGSDSLVFRVPNGDDQEHIVGFDRERARVELLARCLVAGPDGIAPAEISRRLPLGALERIDAALDDSAPDVGTTLDVACPECAHRQAFRLDPYDLGFLATDTLFEEVHSLALHYHWGEAEIFGMPRERRKRYLRMVEKAHGLHS